MLKSWDSSPTLKLCGNHGNSHYVEVMFTLQAFSSCVKQTRTLNEVLSSSVEFFCELVKIISYANVLLQLRESFPMSKACQNCGNCCLSQNCDGTVGVIYHVNVLKLRKTFHTTKLRWDCGKRFFWQSCAEVAGITSHAKGALPTISTHWHAAQHRHKRCILQVHKTFQHWNSIFPAISKFV